MKRRDFLKAAGTFAAGTLIYGCSRAVSGGGAGLSRRPNMIFIMADDLGYGDLGCYGQKLINTPNIDRMALEGIRFTQCYAGAAVCAPSRSVLMTGQHTGHTRVRDNSPAVGGVLEAFGEGSKRLPLEDEDVTVAEVLKKAGYVTGITGKWGLGEPGTAGIPNRQGFDEWYGYLNQNHAPYYYTDYLWHNEKKVTLEGNLNGKKQQYTHDLFTNFSLDFIRRHKHEPFFLYVAYTIPHRRFEVPSTEPYAKQSWPEQAKIYAAMITRMDKDVGRILKLLEELGIDKDTVVFFTSDNGAEGQPKRWNDVFRSGGSLRGAKGQLYEGGIRVPMIVRWPGHVPAARTSDAAWYFADFMPTAGELADARVPSGVDGISVLPLLLGKTRSLPDRCLYWEVPKRKMTQAVRWRNYKAIRNGQDAPLELYDLASDVEEKNNIAEKHPDVIARIEAYLKTARTESPNWPTK